MIATTLNYDYEVRSAEEVFADIPDFKIEGEMLDLARHIISTKKGKFDPTEFDDRYETALAELIRAKIEGRKLPKKPKAEPKKVSNLLDALRQSAGAGSGTGRAKKKAAATKPARKPKTRTPQRKAS